MNKFVYIGIVFILIVCSLVSSILAYIYYPREKLIIVDGTWLSVGPETVKNSIIFNDNGTSTIYFRDASNTNYTSPRPMTVNTRTPILLEATYQGPTGETIKFSSKNGNEGIYSIQPTTSEQMLKYLYQKI